MPFSAWMISCLLLCSLHAESFLFEPRVAYCFPVSSDFREIYAGGGLVGLEASAQIRHTSCYSWIGANMFQKSGHSVGLHSPSSLTLLLLTGGLRYYFVKTSQFSPYLGVGVQPTYLHIHDKAPFVISKRIHWEWGGVFKFGTLIRLKQKAFFDLFVDFSWLKASFSGKGNTIVGREVDLSTLLAGGGLGWDF